MICKAPPDGSARVTHTTVAVSAASVRVCVLLTRRRHNSRARVSRVSIVCPPPVSKDATLESVHNKPPREIALCLSVHTHTRLYCVLSFSLSHVRLPHSLQQRILLCVGTATTGLPSYYPPPSPFTPPPLSLCIDFSLTLPSPPLGNQSTTRAVVFSLWPRKVSHCYLSFDSVAGEIDWKLVLPASGLTVL